MGQGESSPYSNSERIKRVLENEQWDVVPGTTVNLERSDNRFRNKYVIQLEAQVPPNCSMALVFPRHPDPKYRVLWPRGGHNPTLNERFRQSTPKELVATSGDELYRITGMGEGTLYLIWAERINVRTVNQVEAQIMHHVPLLIAMDGRHGYKSIYVFGDRVLHMEDIDEIHEPLHSTLFCCEMDPRVPQGRVVATLSKAASDELASTVVEMESIDGVREPFAPLSERSELGGATVGSGI